MTEEPVRLDKWLWAARFFKTRSLAKDAVDGGKVQYNEQRCKPGKTVEVGASVKIRQGWVDKVVVVKALSAQRKNAVLAQILYDETEESIILREKILLERKQHQGDQLHPQRRPNKRDRRLIHQFKNINSE
ncbi:MAG: ribosome-associated heat shock protein Hsp15 [Oleiphilaceae bacterium]|jgi:ribosome-associated heat shock protein Hsp15